ncbi:MAG: class I SAM-dependent methyltransferase, partial [Actinobacteria bacterium]|nr:class I SAM-dependent methyltransferase [Actinomycetota bacterium]
MAWSTDTVAMSAAWAGTAARPRGRARAAAAMPTRPRVGRIMVCLPVGRSRSTVTGGYFGPVSPPGCTRMRVFWKGGGVTDAREADALPGMYVEAAPWWPLLSPPEEYVEEADHLRGLLRSARIDVRTVLDLGSGGGHLASHLTPHLDVCLVDLSPAMLEVSRGLNPDAEHICADMRTWRGDREFDAVILHDAIDYMATREDLAAALATAYAHCRPGGVVVALPDHTRETYAATTGHGGI